MIPNLKKITKYYIMYLVIYYLTKDLPYYMKCDLIEEIYHLISEKKMWLTSLEPPKLYIPLMFWFSKDFAMAPVTGLNSNINMDFYIPDIDDLVVHEM